MNDNIRIEPIDDNTKILQEVVKRIRRGTTTEWIKDNKCRITIYMPNGTIFTLKLALENNELIIGHNYDTVPLEDPKFFQKANAKIEETIAIYHKINSGLTQDEINNIEGSEAFDGIAYTGTLSDGGEGVPFMVGWTRNSALGKDPTTP